MTNGIDASMLAALSAQFGGEPEETTKDNSAEAATVLDKVRRLVARVNDLEVENVSPSAQLRDELGLDSLKLIEFYVRVEQELGLPTYSGMYLELTTPELVADAVEALQQTESQD